MLKQSLNTKMKLDARLEPALILRSLLLELPLLELESRITEELVDNPFLESGEEIETVENNDDENLNNDKELEDLISTFSNYEDNFPSYSKDTEDEREFQQAYHRTLKESLEEQLSESDLNDHETELGEYIIDNLDDDGFFRLDNETVRESFPDADDDMIEKVIGKIKQLDPPGTGSRNTQEALISQLCSRELHLEDTFIVLNDHFEDLLNKRYDKIMRSTGISREQLQEIIDEIRTLNPKPGSSRVAELWENNDGNDNSGIIPDFIVREIDGKPEVILNNSSVPNLYINKQTEKLFMSGDPRNKQAKEYVRKKLESAKWFINAVYQRRSTLKKVMYSIVKQQKDFFVSGPSKLKPMILKDVAEDIEMDIATVSRATKEKYVDTDFGIFELKYFFTEGTAVSDGEDVSSRIIKEKLREIISAEDKNKPLSDQKISEILTAKGYKTARRTVQKYREQLKLPAARLRKEL